MTTPERPRHWHTPQLDYAIQWSERAADCGTCGDLAKAFMAFADELSETHPLPPPGGNQGIDQEWHPYMVEFEAMWLAASGAHFPRKGMLPAKIFVNKQEPKRRQRFTAAHEFAHILLNEGGFSPDMGAGEEALADGFASRLLVSRRRLRDMTSALNAISPTVLKDLSAIFCVGNACMALALTDVWRPEWGRLAVARTFHQPQERRGVQRFIVGLHGDKPWISPRSASSDREAAELVRWVSDCSRVHQRLHPWNVRSPHVCVLDSPEAIGATAWPESLNEAAPKAFSIPHHKQGASPSP